MCLEEPQRVLADEICSSAEGGMASVRTLDQVMHLLPSGLELLNLVDTKVGDTTAATVPSVSNKRAQSSHRCVGTTANNQQCKNSTLLMYRRDATHPWKSLCWRHKQQIFAVIPALQSDPRTSL